MLLLDIRNLTIELITSTERIRVVDQVNIKLSEGEILGLVGESGSGKSLIAQAISGLTKDNWHIYAERFSFNGINLLKLSPKQRQKVVGKYVSMIFQEPRSCLDPSQRIKKQLIQAIPGWTYKGKWWQRFNWRKKRAIELLHRVGIKDHQDILSSYAYEITEGECQKIMIAIALAHQPKLLVADEPTNAMDTTTEVQIFRLLTSINQNSNTSILFISHNLKMMTKWANKIQVLYCGQTVEIASSEELIKTPYHPYTEALIRTVPDFVQAMPHKSLLNTLSGVIPSLENLPIGCRLGPRCFYAQKKCIKAPPLLAIRDHSVACHFPLNINMDD